jgi:hypothetical protein
MAGTITSVIAPQQLDALDPQQMRQALLSLMAEVAAKDELLARKRAKSPSSRR